MTMQILSQKIQRAPSPTAGWLRWGLVVLSRYRCWRQAIFSIGSGCKVALVGWGMVSGYWLFVRWQGLRYGANIVYCVVYVAICNHVNKRNY